MMKNEIRSGFTDHWSYMAISTACELDLFELIECGKTTIEHIKDRLKTTGDGIDNLISHLHKLSYIKKDGDQYELTEKGKLLTENNPERIKYSCLLWSKLHLDALQGLKKSILTGESYFTMEYGETYFDLIKQDPREFLIYHKAMDEYARDDYEHIAQYIDLKGVQKVMDVGGGSGRLIKALQKTYPEKHFVLFDEPEVLDLFDTSGIDAINGNFFEAIPETADLIILSRVLHDWNDKLASEIILNCKSCLPYEGRLLIIENCDDLTTTKHELLSLNMLAMCGSTERTSSEYIDLIVSKGFKFTSVKQLNSLQFILEFKKT